LTELFDATLDNKKRAAEPANDMITGSNKKGKQVTDNDVMHIPWNISYRAKTGTKKEHPASDDYSTWDANQIRK
jgi:hypothetical protein